MSSNQGVNITKYMLGNSNAPANVSKTIFTPFTGVTGNASTGPVMRSSIARIASYILAIIIVLLVILLFIHFFIKPIFRLQPGGSGIIPVPGFDDGKLFWNKTSSSQILNKDLPIASLAFGYTINLDVFVENPLQFSKHPRIFFSRGATRNETPTGESILGVLNNYNIIAALVPDTNDLLVSVLNKNNNEENVYIPNIPIQEPFRLSMVVMERALEVYINGHLMKTRTFSAPPKDVKGDIYPAAGIEANIVKVKNLKVWARLLTVAEIRQSTPSLSTAKDFGGVPMPSSTSCSTAASTTMTDPEKGMDRFMKLSADTMSDPNSKLL
jgi:hypothetical protein